MIHFFQIDGITIGSLDDIPSGPVSTFFRSIRNTLDFDFEDDNEGWFCTIKWCKEFTWAQLFWKVFTNGLLLNPFLPLMLYHKRKLGTICLHVFVSFGIYINQYLQSNGVFKKKEILVLNWKDTISYNLQNSLLLYL